MRALIFAAFISTCAFAQSTSVKITDPTDLTKQAGVTNVGGQRGLNVNCIAGCAATINMGDAGLTVNSNSWFPDGGAIGFERMPDGGALEVYVINPSGGSSGGGWTPDGGFIGSVAQGSSVDGGQEWAVLNPGVTSAGNSSTSLLGSNATFTGAWVEALNYSVINAVAFSDVASAPGGWKLQWSGDGSNVDAQEAVTLNAGSGRALAINTRARFFRVVYTNGASAQGVFRLATTLHQSGTGLNNYPLDKALYPSSMSILTRSVITGETTAGGGSFVNVKVNPSGSLVSEVTQASVPWLVAGADGGAVDVTGAWWAPDGGFIGTVYAFSDGGVTAYQGGSWSVGVTGSVAVTGPLTDAQLRATPVPISGTLASTQSGTWSVRNQDGAGNSLASSTTTPTGSEQALVVRNIPSGTQAVSGSVSATVSGTVAATQSGTWAVRNQDGAGNALASGTTAPAGTEQALIVRPIPSGTQTVSGTVTANAGTGPWPVTDNGGSLTVDGTVAATQSGTWNVTNISGTVSLPTGAATETTLGTRLADSTFTGRFSTPAALSDATANPSVTVIGSYLMGYNGTTWDRLRKSATGLLVDIGNTSIAVTQSGAWNVGLNAGTNYIGRTRLTDGSLDVSLLNSAPGSDTGQVALPVRIISSLAGGAGGTSSSFGSAFPASGTAAGFSDGTNMVGARTFDADTGAGTQNVLGVNLRVGASGGSTEAAAGAGTTSTSTLRVVLPTDQTVIPVSDNGGSLTVDGTVTVTQGTASSLRAQTSAESAAAAAAPANAMAIGYKDTAGNLQHPISYDTDTGAGTQWTAGSVLVTGNSGGAAQVTGRGTSDGYNGLSVHMLYKATSTITNSAVTCSTSATAMPAAVQSNRSTLSVYNNSTQTVYVGGASVTTANGFPVPAGGYWVDDVRVGAYYCIVAAGSSEVRVLEQ